MAGLEPNWKSQHEVSGASCRHLSGNSKAKNPHSAHSQSCNFFCVNQGTIDDGIRINKLVECEKQVGAAQYNGLGAMCSDEALGRFFEVSSLVLGRFTGNGYGDIVCVCCSQLVTRNRNHFHSDETVKFGFHNDARTQDADPFYVSCEEMSVERVQRADKRKA